MILKMWVKVRENGWVKVREKLPPQVVDWSWKITRGIQIAGEQHQSLGNFCLQQQPLPGAWAYNSRL